MLLLYLACGAVLAAGVLVCCGIGPRRRSDVVTGSLALALAMIALLGKVLLLAGVYRPVPITAAALCCAAGPAPGWQPIAVPGSGRP